MSAVSCLTHKRSESFPHRMASWMSRCGRSGLLASSSRKRTGVLPGFVLATVCQGLASAILAASTDPTKSMLSARTDAPQSEFERLMAVARETRQGAGTRVRHLSIENRPAIGNENAPLVLIEVASFECPYCRRHWLEAMPALRRSHINAGRLRYVFVDVALDPTHVNAKAVAEAAHCANEQGQYAAFRNRIFTNQKATSAAFLEAHAQAVSLDIKAFRHCMASGRYKAQVENDVRLMRALRVRGTPSFFWARRESDRSDVRLIRRISGVQSFDEFAGQFDALQKMDKTTTTTVVDTTL